jgi:hypothetical protein
MRAEVRARGRRRRRRRSLFVAVIVIGTAAFFLRPAASHSLHSLGRHSGAPSTADIAKLDIAKAAAISPLRGRIVALAESQVGYRTDPSNTYCNKYSAYWISGTNDCGNANLDEKWCADFAAWVWQKAGAVVIYQYVNGDLNSSSASFYEWGVARGTWHPVGSGYVPQPGDVAVYGLDVSTLVAQHDAIVVSYAAGNRGPDAVNGDGDRTGFSVVEIGNDEHEADVTAKSPAFIAGYVSPS